MRRYILTGAPGSGKTAIIRALADKGHAVVEEAATDVIAAEHARGCFQPWREPRFIEQIARLQIDRMDSAVDRCQFHDRSLFCTYALAVYLGYPIPALLTDGIARCVLDGAFQQDVLFVESLGFIEHTAARRITPDEAVRFAEIHEETYGSFGFHLVRIPPGRVDERVTCILSHVNGGQV